MSKILLILSYILPTILPMYGQFISKNNPIDGSKEVTTETNQVVYKMRGKEMFMLNTDTLQITGLDSTKWNNVPQSFVWVDKKGYVYVSSFASINNSIAPEWNNIQSRPSTFTPTAHTHPISEVIGLQDSLNARLRVEVDGSITNELQSLSISGRNLSITGGNTIYIPQSTDSSNNNEIQNLSYNSGTGVLGITNGTGVTLPVITPFTIYNKVGVLSTGGGIFLDTFSISTGNGYSINIASYLSARGHSMYFPLNVHAIRNVVSPQLVPQASIKNWSGTTINLNVVQGSESLVSVTLLGLGLVNLITGYSQTFPTVVNDIKVILSYISW